MSGEDCDRALAHSFRDLEPAGLFRLIVPDFSAYIDSYLEDSSEHAVHVFLESSALGRTRRARGLEGLIREWLGNSAQLRMWDERSMAARLRNHGFVNIRRATCGDSEDTRFMEVENPDRFVDALAMQCARPR